MSDVKLSLYHKGLILKNVAGMKLRENKVKKNKSILFYSKVFTGNCKAFYDKYKDEYDFAFLTNNPNYVPKEIKVLHATKMLDLIEAMSYQIVIADHGLGMFSDLFKKNNVKRIYVGHGIGFKKYTKKQFEYYKNNFDLLFASSQYIANYWNRKYEIPLEMIKVTGYARTDGIVNKLDNNKILLALSWYKGDNSWENEFSTGLEHENDNKVILATTWGQEKNTKQEIDIKKLKNKLISLGFDVHERKHVNLGVIEET